MDSIIRYLVGELNTIAHAPVVFVAALLVLGGAIWWAMDWRYSGIISNRDSEISTLKKERDSYRNKLGGASPDEAAQKIAELEKRIDSAIPRYLTAAQKRSIFDALPKGPYEIRIFVEGACSDCGQYANDFADAFATAGWNVERAINLAGLGIQSTGLAIGISDRSNPPSSVPVLTTALHAAGLSFDIVEWRSTTPQKASLLITHRPAGPPREMIATRLIRS